MTEPETTCKGFEVNHLVKQYANADKPVLDDISFKVKHGSGVKGQKVCPESRIFTD